MKVILLEDVYKKGVAGEVVEVAPGFACNFLIPKGMAQKATPGALKMHQNLRARAASRRSEREQENVALAERLQELVLYFSVKAGETGKLYGSITPADISLGIQQELGIEVDRRRIGDKLLRDLGAFEVPVRLDAGLTAHIGVVIFREGQDPRPTEPELAEAGLEESSMMSFVDDLEAEGQASPAGEMYADFAEPTEPVATEAVADESLSDEEL